MLSRMDATVLTENQLRVAYCGFLVMVSETQLFALGSLRESEVDRAANLQYQIKFNSEDRKQRPAFESVKPGRFSSAIWVRWIG